MTVLDFTNYCVLTYITLITQVPSKELPSPSSNPRMLQIILFAKQLEQTWAPNRIIHIRPIHECKLKKLATIPSWPWNFVQIPKIPQAKATPWRQRCTNFFKFLEPGNHPCTKMAETIKRKNQKTTIQNSIRNPLIFCPQICRYCTVLISTFSTNEDEANHH